MPWIIFPGIPLRTVNPGEAAGHVHPHGMIVVLDGPMDLVAGKAVLTAQRFDVTVLDAAQSAFGRGPNGEVWRLLDRKAGRTRL